MDLQIEMLCQQIRIRSENTKFHPFFSHTLNIIVLLRVIYVDLKGHCVYIFVRCLQKMYATVCDILLHCIM